MADKLPVKELDFFETREQLKTYLKQQSAIKDYDFEGSNMSVLLDVLAYNTYHNAFYNNMALSEMFLDSAQLEETVDSHAKHLNYLPKSMTSAKTKISFTIAGDGNPSFIVIPRNTRFVSTSGTTKYYFYNDAAYTVYPDSKGIYFVDCMEVFEGTLINEYYTVSGDIDQKFVISNENLDLNSIRVYEIFDDSTEKEYVLKNDLFGVSSTDRVFYIQKSFSHYEIYFGKNLFGSHPTNSNKIRIEYRITVGEEANGITKLSQTSYIDGRSISNITLDSVISGGLDKETISSIKYYAPKSIQIQERAVTENDYKILIKREFPTVQSVSVIGGEKLSPPKFGKVIVYIDTSEAYGASENIKNQIKTFLDKRMPLSLQSIVYNAEFMYINVISNVTYDTSKTDKSEADIRGLVRDKMLAYSDLELNDFNKTLRYSKFLKEIDSAHEYITSNDTQVRAIIEFTPSTVIANNVNLNFDMKLVPTIESNSNINVYAAIMSSSFTFNGQTAIIKDNGYGDLQIVKIENGVYKILKKNVGSVNYETGAVSITSLRLSKYSGGSLKIYANMNKKNITAPKNKIVVIRDKDISISIQGE